MRKLILLYVTIHALTSCTDSEVPVIEASKSNTLIEMRLGESDYYISLPVNFKLEEVRGKEGQLGYSIFPTDTLIKMNGFVEIRYGSPIGETYRGEPGKIFVESKLVDKKVKWTIYQSKDGTFNGYTDEKEELNVDVSSKSRMGIDSMISWISTLQIK